MKPRPYVGITGFTKKEEVDIAKEAFWEHVIPKGYDAMFGIVCSSTRWRTPQVAGTLSPSIEDMEQVLGSIPAWGLATIHYFQDTTSTNLYEELRGVLRPGYYSGLVKALQLNVEWPSAQFLKKTRHEYPDLGIILQVNLKTTNRDIDEACKLSEYYEGLVDYVLVDSSRGQGKEFLEEDLILFERLHKILPNSRIGIAGGLRADNVREKLATVKPYAINPRLHGDYGKETTFSIDAQGGLRDAHGLVPERVVNYLRNAASLLTTPPY